MSRKRDADEILAQMQQLPSSLGLEGSRRSWPNWLYRSDHVENAAQILNSGRLLSRAVAERREVIRVDSGSPQYVGQLSTRHRNLVRLYFRPRTPTQYRNEGIRPRDRIELDAHMPVPVYLLFASSLLAEEGVRFSKGRLHEGTAVGGSAEFLKSMAFEDVYHDRAVGRLGESSRRSEIINARHSEVLVENELSLDKVKHVVCRSAPERDTLLNLLSRAARRQWQKRIRVDEGDRRVFQKRGTFVERVELSSSASRFLFYSNTEVELRGPFELKVERRVGRRTTSAGRDEFVVSNRPVVYPLSPPAPRYRVRVLLDGNLAYLGEFDEEDGSEMLV